MKYYNLMKMMQVLEYTERGSKCIITRRKNEQGLSIDDNTRVSEEDVIIILDTLSRKGIASIIRRREEFLSKEDEGSSEGTIPEDNHDILKDKHEETQEEDSEIDLLALKRKNFANMKRGVPSSVFQGRGRGKKHYEHNSRGFK